MSDFKWRVSKQKGIVYYCRTDGGLQQTVLRLAKAMHSAQTIKIKRIME